MRSCEFSHVTPVGKTINIRLGGIRFYAQDLQLIPHHHPQLLELAVFVWVRFDDQKNRLKFDSRTQMKTKDPLLCPVNSIGRAVQRVIKFVKGYNDDTPLCTFHKRGRRSRYITQDYSLKFIRKICDTYGSVERFGYHKDEIRNKSIRSGAAMALFLNNHSSDKIMILGRWKSKAFLDHIRTQVVQWIRLFSNNMILFNNFFELCATIEKGGGRKESKIQQKRGHFNMPHSMFL